MSKETKIIGTKIVLAWIFSVIFIVGGLTMFTESFLSGLLTLSAGALILPPLSKWVEEKYNLKVTSWLKVIIILILLIIAGGFLPSDNIDNEKEAEILVRVPDMFSGF